MISEKTELFINKAREIHGDRYDYSLVNYKNNKTKVKIICKEHGIFEQTSKNHVINKQGCSKCAGVKLLTQEEFILRAKLKHGNRYNYSLVDYKKGKEKIKIICNEHGVFDQIAQNHLIGQNCPKCAAITIVEKNKRFNTDIFLQKAKEIHRDNYD